IDLSSDNCSLVLKGSLEAISAPKVMLLRLVVFITLLLVLDACSSGGRAGGAPGGAAAEKPDDGKIDVPGRRKREVDDVDEFIGPDLLISDDEMDSGSGVDGRIEVGGYIM
ncbi:hypothetical protein PFISCL1PPCAC_3464, partial [Pristionchus fissidentatus]